jgi:threonine dehydrogenase-like Zn-dependent dehydrogenase
MRTRLGSSPSSGGGAVVVVGAGAVVTGMALVVVVSSVELEVQAAASSPTTRLNNQSRVKGDDIVFEASTQKEGTRASYHFKTT